MLDQKMSESITKDNSKTDEIDLRELLLALWHGKYIVLVVTGLCFVLATVYALKILPPISETQAKIRPVSSDKYIRFNNANVINVNADSLFQRMYSDLVSGNRLHGFSQKHHQQLMKLVPDRLKENDEKAFAHFASFNFKFTRDEVGIKLKGYNKKNLVISLAYNPNVVDGPGLVNDYVDYVQKMGLSELMIEYRNIKREKINKLLRDYELLLNITKSRRINRIAQINESLVKAKALGVKERMIDINILMFDVFRQKTKNNRITVGDIQPNPLLGSKYLEAELHFMMEKNDDSQTNADLMSLENDLLALNVTISPQLLKSDQKSISKIEANEIAKEIDGALDVHFPELALIDVSATAREPLETSNKKRLLIILASIMLGFMLSIIILFIRNALINTSDTFTQR